ncbi:hypothetical protein AVEN_236821-1 [Araneus ventricosus]|uniref:Uncharacterized protein n=1 Tax=Araneus ventricosus TaxID=182803 RepID=A0A4Y2W641_ARAVE|nr:hypothetical protein AVEN_236821-1 [Araneus ventricosus]
MARATGIHVSEVVATMWSSNQIIEEEAVVSQRYLQPTFYQHLKISMEVKTSMQKTWSNCWLLTSISSNRLCRMKISSAPSQLVLMTMIMATSSLKITHSSYIIRME